MAESMTPYVQTFHTRQSESKEGLPEKETTLTSKGTQKRAYNKNKDKNLIKRGKTWTCIIYVYDPVKGKKKPEWHGGFKVKAEARAALVQLQAEADARGALEITDMTFKQYTELYMKMHEGHFRPGTIKYYDRVLRYTGAIDDIPMKKIKAEDISRVHETLKSAGTLSPQSVHKYLVQVKVIFNFAYKRGDIAVHPFMRFVMPPSKYVKHHAPTNDQIIDMINGSKGTLIYLPILLAVMLGLRRGEVFGLQYGDFDFIEETVAIQRQVINCAVKGVDFQAAELKTESSTRKLKVPASLLKLISEMKEAHPEHQFVMSKEDGTRYTPTYIMGLYSQFCKTNGYSVRFHDLRHAYGTICLNNKIPIKAISDTMGHHNIEVTSNIYCDTRELLDAPAQLMEEKFGALVD